MCESLERHGFAVRAAENGLVAKAIFDTCPADCLLIISDAQMPVMDGITLLSHIKQSNQLTKLILMTGLTDAVIEKKALDFGVDEILPKPFLASTLLEMIARCLDRDPSCVRSRSPDLKLTKITGKQHPQPLKRGA